MKTKNAAALFCCLGTAFLAEAGGYYTWTNAAGDGDWTNPANFAVGNSADGEVSTVCPGGEDEVYIPVGVTVSLEYDTQSESKMKNWEAVSAVKHFRPLGRDSVFEITVPEGESGSLECAITRGKTLANYDVGHIIKRGKGELRLNSLGRVNTDEYYDYFTALTVEEGTLRLYSGETRLAEHYHLGKVTVNEGGTLFIANTEYSISTIFRYLYGGGLITNGYATVSRIEVGAYGVFSGVMAGPISYYSAGKMHLTGDDSTFVYPSSFDFIVYQNYGRGTSNDHTYGEAAIMKFGKKAVDGVSTPSSIGYNETLLVRDNGGAFRYLGDGETTDKDLRIWPQSTPYPTYLDGGAHGGLVWTGLWGHRDAAPSSYQHKMQRLILQGSNTQECVMKGIIEDKPWRGTNYTFCITKQGSGTWRIAHNDDSGMLGVWRVIDGTLRFDTLAEAGVNSALGSSTMLYKDLGGVLALDENKVDYAFWLGGGDTGRRADLEYVGSSNCVSTTRRFAVNGTGALLNNGSGRLRIEDFYSTDMPSTLVLGGTNALENVADKINDGEDSALSVIKEGSGTWRIGADSGFTGALEVKAGRLIVGNADKYNYYRWIVKESFYGSATRGGSSSQMFGVTSFGLFDAEGNDRTYGVTDDGEWYQGSYYTGKEYDYRDYAGADLGVLGIGEGRVRITHYDGSENRLTMSPSTAVSDMFMHGSLASSANKKYIWSRDASTNPPWHENPETWMVFTIRPVKGAPITSWDFVNSTANGGAYQAVKMCELQASVDGREWDSLSNLDYGGYTAEYRPKFGTWRSDNTTVYEPGYTTHTTGMPIPPGPTNSVVFNASSVSVAAGAELVARSPESPVISRLVVDGTAGGGRIDGFSFASDGTLEIVNAPALPRYTAAMEIENASGLDATADWTLMVDGQAKAGVKAKISAAGVTVWHIGTQIVIR